jgi:hypothetical protein
VALGFLNLANKGNSDWDKSLVSIRLMVAETVADILAMRFNG